MNGFRPTSIKTRIETRVVWREDGVSLDDVLDQHPSKQGLKLVFFLKQNTTHWVLDQHPSKQGLKPIRSNK